MPPIPAKINVGSAGPAAWLQAGLQYGINDSGPFQSYTKRGTRAEVEDLAAPLAALGFLYTVTLEAGGLARIDASKSNLLSDEGAEVPENIWELDPNETEKNLLEADFASGVSGQIGYVSEINRAKIKDALARPEDFINLFPAFTTSGGGTIADADSLYLLMKNDVSAFPMEASIIRHTRTFSNTYVLPGGLFNNVNRIISTSGMYSIEGVPTSILYTVPSPPTVAQYIESAGDLAYGWRKVRPAVTRISRTKWRTTQNWQFGLWAVKLYGNVL